MSAGTKQRDRVATIAPKNASEALSLARGIEDPWFRCQALAIAAVHVRDVRSRKSAIDDAFSSASKLTEPNRIVTASAWPIKALVLAGEVSTRLSSEIDRLLRVISTEPSPVRRSDALMYLLGSVSGAPAHISHPVAREFVGACFTLLENGRRNHKGESNLEVCLPGIARIDPAFADSLLKRFTPSRCERAENALKATKDRPLTELLAWPNLQP